MAKERKVRGPREPDAPAAAGAAAVPAKTFSYAIRVAGALRPVLTVSGSEEHRDTWVARAVAIAEESPAADGRVMVWEAEVGSGGVGAASYALIYPAMNDTRR
jgi:hypothetical protein